MKLYQKILATGALIAAVGCCEQPKPQTLEGTVKEEFGTTQRISESSGAIFNDDPTPTYGFVLETDKGEYVIGVSALPRQKPVCALAKAIETGDRVRITYDAFTKIGKDRIGRTNSDTIELIEKAK